MYAFMNVPRDYQTARTLYRFTCPERFNFAYDVIDRRGREADRLAVLAVSDGGVRVQRLRYSDLARRSSRLANGLRAAGLGKGDFACIVAGRIPEWYDVVFACMKRGIVAMPGTTLLTGPDIAYRVNQTRARAVIVSPEHCEKVEAVRAGCPTLTHLVVIGKPRPGWISTEELTAGQPDEVDPGRRPDLRSDDMMLGYFTSGTTGMPKMVPRDFSYGLAHAATGLFWMDLRPEDIHWTLTDTGWAKAAWGILFPPMLMGCTTVLFDTPGFDADQHLRLVAELGVTSFCAPPTAYRMFAQMDLSQYDFSTLRRSISAGEPLNPEVMRSWQQATGTVIADGYGQTETVNIVANFPDQPVKFGSMGQPVPGFEVDVVDDAGQPVPPGEIGNIAVRIAEPSPPGLFSGYFTGAAPDRGAFRNGWYYTGDTATRDEDGYFWFVGRADDIITSGGYRISPFEVESALLEHPAVAESAVVARPDPLRGEIVSAHVILAPGGTASDALVRELQEHCKRVTAPYKYPREIRFVETLPKTISGKIRRVELRTPDAG